MSRIVQFSTRGGPDVLDILEVPEPHPGSGQIRVAMRAAGLNPFDFKVRNSGDFLPNLPMPSGQGNEFAGVVDEIGEGVDSIAVGAEVLGWVGFAAQADFVVVPATNVALKPAGLDWATAGGIGLVGNTAMRMVAAIAPTTGETILVSGAAGGVGLFAAQLALHAGARVIGTASESNHSFLAELGIIPVSYGPGLADRLRELAPQGIDAVLDQVGEETVRAGLELGAPASRINTLAWYAGAKEFGIATVGGGEKTALQLAEIAELVASGAVVMPIAATFPLAEVRAAYTQLETRHLRGKIVLVN